MARLLALFACFGLGVAFSLEAQEGRPVVTVEDYARAEKVLDGKVRALLLNPRLEINWLAEGRELWFRRRTSPTASEYVLVEAATGRARPLYDEDKLHPVLDQVVPVPAAQSESKPGPRPLTVLEVRESEGRRLLVLEVPPLEKSHVVEVDLASYAARKVPFPSRPKPDELRSPDGTRGVFARKHNLWLRDAKTARELQLTYDGAPYFAYGKLPDASLVSVPAQREGRMLPPRNVEWSPDGRWLVGRRFDEREVAPMPFVEWVPQDGSHRPKLYQLRLNLPGDRTSPTPESAFVLEANSGQQRALSLPEGWRFAYLPFSWMPDARQFLAIAFRLGGNGARLLRIDAATGEIRTVAEETSPKVVWLNEYLYSRPNTRLLADGTEAIWFSQRSGWGHLELYDVGKGELKRTLTNGPWLVRDIIDIDDKARVVYFTASGREPGWDPYYRGLYRVSLEGGEPELLTPEVADHALPPPLVADSSTPKDAPALPADFSPNHQFFVDTASTVREPAVFRLREAATGRIIAELGKSDAGAVLAAGWQAPERTTVKSADRRYDLACVIYYPPNYRKDRKYPVIDAFYGGTQMTNAPTVFAEAVATRNPVSRASLAQLGFIVVTIDARGTPGRSKAFHDFGHGSFADPQVEDHVAGIKELAERLGTLDLDRVGVYGHSFGGYTSARAILSRPDFYKVCVSSAGPHNFQGFYDGLGAFVGAPDYGQGARLRPKPQAVPENYQVIDNGPLAKNLRGKLMLVYGDMDENALPSVTIQLVEALIKANKTFDLVHLPNRTHEFFRDDKYYTRRMWDYFVEHLLGAKPPENYEIK